MIILLTVPLEGGFVQGVPPVMAEIYGGFSFRGTFSFPFSVLNVFGKTSYLDQRFNSVFELDAIVSVMAMSHMKMAIL